MQRIASAFAGLEGKATRCFVHDGSDGLEAAIANVYGPSPHQRCICHKLGNVWDAVQGKEAHGELREDAAGVYDVATADEARERLAALAAKWQANEPAAVVRHPPATHASPTQARHRSPPQGTPRTPQELVHLLTPAEAYPNETAHCS